MWGKYSISCISAPKNTQNTNKPTHPLKKNPKIKVKPKNSKQKSPTNKNKNKNLKKKSLGRLLIISVKSTLILKFEKSLHENLLIL